MKGMYEYEYEPFHSVRRTTVTRIGCCPEIFITGLLSQQRAKYLSGHMSLGNVRFRWKKPTVDDGPRQLVLVKIIFRLIIPFGETPRSSFIVGLLRHARVSEVFFTSDLFILFWNN